jgi:predicted unusual protein kinase regulating ubiquinone biosynthesis (AarF/ABC1/UbiB family)
MKTKSVPAGRVGRLLHMGRLAGGVAGGMLGAGLKQVASGNRPQLGDMLLTPANATRVANRLAEMRGAAMKVGQLISMESSDLLPAELTEILSRLRQQAYSMPLGQVAEVLNKSWGDGWEKQFSRFSFTPLASASIGQVHEALTRDGRRLAIKIQYPGVRQSIDSDVDNVSTLLSLLKLVPADVLGSLLDEAKRQLHAEAEYLGEADHLRDYGSRLDPVLGFVVPTVDAALTTSEVLAMEFMEGTPIEWLARADQDRRDSVATRMLELSLTEFFDWGLVQTDPNYANFLYQSDTDRIVLLDFGATRPYPAARREAFRQLMQASIDQDDSVLEEAAQQVGYLGQDDDSRLREAMLKLLHMATEPARTAENYDFGQSDLAERMSQVVVELRMQSRVWRLPPPDILFLHRKLGGMYMLCKKLNARVDVNGLLHGYRQTLN